jgi:hypothetical protein
MIFDGQGDFRQSQEDCAGNSGERRLVALIDLGPISDSPSVADSSSRPCSLRKDERQSSLMILRDAQTE